MKKPFSLSALIRKFNKIKTFILIIIISCGLFVGINMIKIKDIQMHGISKLEGLDLYYNERYFFVHKKDIALTLYTKNPKIRTIKVKKQFPSTIILSVTENIPVGYMNTKDGFFVIANDTRIREKITQKNNVNLPIINYYQSLYFQQYEVGDKIDFIDIIYALYFLEKLEDINISIDTIDIERINMIVCKGNDNKEYIFTTDREKEVQYEDIRSVVKQFYREDKDYTKIDVRFDKPLIIK